MSCSYFIYCGELSNAGRMNKVYGECLTDKYGVQKSNVICCRYSWLSFSFDFISFGKCRLPLCDEALGLSYSLFLPCLAFIQHGLSKCGSCCVSDVFLLTHLTELILFGLSFLLCLDGSLEKVLKQVGLESQVIFCILFFIQFIFYLKSFKYKSVTVNI